MPGGMNASPPIAWSGVPDNAHSFILSIVNRHPRRGDLVHWAVINIPGRVREMPERASGIRDRMPVGSQELRNSFGETGYVGPHVTPGSGTQEYDLEVFALSEESFEFGPLAILPDVLSAVRDRIIDAGAMKALLSL